MLIRFEHNVGQAGAVRRLNEKINSLMRQSFPGVTIKDPQSNWRGNVLNFSFRARKGLFSPTISGTVTVTDKSVVLESQLPGTVSIFVGEDKIKSVIKAELRKILV